MHVRKKRYPPISIGILSKPFINPVGNFEPKRPYASYIHVIAKTAKGANEIVVFPC